MVARKKAKDLEDIYRRVAIFSWAIIGGLVLALLLLFALYQIRSVLTPFIYALIIVYLLRPVVNCLEEKGVPRWLGVILSYLMVVVVISLVGVYLVPVAIEQGGEFLTNFPQYLQVTIKLVHDLQARLARFPIPPAAADMLAEGLLSIRNSLLKSLSQLPSATVNVVSGLFNLILAPVLAFFLLKDLRAIKKGIVSLIPPRHRKETTEIIGKIDLVLRGFLRGQLLVALAVGILCSIALTIIGLDYAVIIGMVTGALNIIPYFGPIVGGVLAALVGLFSSWKLALAAVIAMVIIQLIDGFFLSPHILSQQTKLHPVLVVFSLLVGGALYGIMGMLLAVPLAAASKALVMHFYERSTGSGTEKIQ